MKKKAKTIVELQSDTHKIEQLGKQLAELERSLGQKQIELEFSQKMIELAEDAYQVDIKKNLVAHYSLVLAAPGRA